MKIPNDYLDVWLLGVSLARIVSEDSQLRSGFRSPGFKSSKDS